MGRKPSLSWSNCESGVTAVVELSVPDVCFSPRRHRPLVPPPPPPPPCPPPLFTAVDLFRRCTCHAEGKVGKRFSVEHRWLPEGEEPRRRVSVCVIEDVTVSWGGHMALLDTGSKVAGCQGFTASCLQRAVLLLFSGLVCFWDP